MAGLPGERMKKFAMLLGMWALGTAPAALPADLVEVYQRALQNDPQLREAEATRLASLEAKPQAISALLPQLSATGSWTRDKESGEQDQVQQVSDPTSPTGFSELHFNSDGTSITRSRNYGLQLRQSIFSWTNWVALKRADSQVAQAEADYQSARQDLVTRVAQRYFDVLAAQDDLDAQQAASSAIQHQLEQAEQRYNVGLIAITDVKEARAAHDSAVADVIAAKRTLASAQEALREITGDSFSTLARPVESMALTSPDPASEDQWVQKALEQNLSLISSRLAADIARQDISTARGGHAPTLDFVATGGKNISDGDMSYAFGGTGASAIDLNYRTISLQVTVPLYSGGGTNSRVREAVYRHRASRERLERVARETERNTRDAYLGVLSEISRVKALQQALESNLTALQATEAGYEAGTRTAVDVLQSRRLLIQAQTNYARSRYDYILNVLKLQSEAGILSRQSLDSINGLLKEGAPKITDPGQASGSGAGPTARSGTAPAGALPPASGAAS